MNLTQVLRCFQPGQVKAVDGVDLTLAKGELLALLGPSGCGKTTLLRLIAGLERPDGGRIDIAGRSVAGEGHWVPPEGRRLGMVFQDYALFPHLSVAENIGFGLKRSPRKSAAQIRDRVAQSLELVGLTGLEKRYPHELSGGQQQRVALARALAPDPALVLLDEPLSNLDVQVRQRLRDEVRSILKASGASGIFVTHDCEEALAIADKVAVMRQGQIEQLDRPEVLYWEPASQFVAAFVVQMNFIRGRYQSEGWETELGAFTGEVTSAALDTLPPALTTGMERILGVRQDNLRVKDAGGDRPTDRPVNGRILSREFLGRDYRYTLELRPHPNFAVESPKVLQALVPLGDRTAGPFDIGDHVTVTLGDAPLQAFPKP